MQLRINDSRRTTRNPAVLTPASATPDAKATMRPLLVSVTEATNLLGIGRTTLYELIGDGHVAPVKIGRSVRFVVDELETFVEALRAAR